MKLDLCSVLLYSCLFAAFSSIKSLSSANYSSNDQSSINSGAEELPPSNSPHTNSVTGYVPEVDFSYDPDLPAMGSPLTNMSHTNSSTSKLSGDANGDVEMTSTTEFPDDAKNTTVGIPSILKLSNTESSTIRISHGKFSSTTRLVLTDAPTPTTKLFTSDSNLDVSLAKPSSTTAPPARVLSAMSSLLEIYSYYCPNMCNRNASKNTADLEEFPCCMICRCQNICGKQNYCCPGYHNESRATHQDPVYISTSFPLSGDTEVLERSYFMWNKCPEDSDAMSNCLRNDTLEAVTPVSISGTGTIYRNKFCATCHSVGNNMILTWSAYVRCTSLEPLSVTANSPDDIFEYVRRSNTCFIEFKPPENASLNHHRCRMGKDATNNYTESDKYSQINQECNTIFGQAYDRHMVNGADIFQRHRIIFCAMCVKVNLSSYSYLCPAFGNVQNNISKLNEDSVLVAEIVMDTTQRRNTILNVQNVWKVCGQKQVFDPLKNTCRMLYCPFGHQAYYGDCLPFLHWSTDIIVEFTFQVQTERPAIANVTTISWEISQILQIPNEAVCSVEGFSLSTTSEQISFILSMSVHVQFGTAETDLLAKINTLLEPSQKLIVPERSTDSNQTWTVTIVPYNQDSNHSISITEKQGCRCKPIPFNKLFFCKQVKLYKSEFQLEESVLLLLPSRLILNKYEFILSEDGSVRVCMINYFENTRSLRRDGASQAKLPVNPKSEDQPITPEAIVSFVCTIISIVCLFFIIITYSLFRTLRNNFGILLRVLCGNILLAQTFFQFGAGQTDDPTLCAVLGMIIHYLWLCVFTAMSTCIVFVTKTVVAMQNPMVDSSLPKVYILFVYSSPAAIVVVCSFIPLLESDFQHTGYGGVICFLNSRILFGLFFLGPLVATIVFNTTMCVRLIYNIHKTTTAVKSTSREKKAYTFMYLRISVFTGLTWVFAFLYMLTEQDVFEYLFLVLNCGIGLILFLSFMVKKRILSLYLCDRGTDDDLALNTMETHSRRENSAVSRQTDEHVV